MNEFIEGAPRRRFGLVPHGIVFRQFHYVYNFARDTDIRLKCESPKLPRIDRDRRRGEAHEDQ
ncbi:hypothetical protein NECAME_04025 [Necator americanus]|uniref:Uncharacterized protein n=1 Tax=Necator americanus TaxID=51031 RepID=W2SXQ0_NECAM|nr:hypothetical protein NECAME_04025 [Necator americanus]ETN74539.1 hypothetical protein NECAME_04025 [Necator americanus]